MFASHEDPARCPSVVAFFANFFANFELFVKIGSDSASVASTLRRNMWRPSMNQLEKCRILVFLLIFISDFNMNILR